MFLYWLFLFFYHYPNDEGKNGTYAPAVWDQFEASSSPRNFTFLCTRYQSITAASLSLINPNNNTFFTNFNDNIEFVSNNTSFNATDLIQVDYLLLYDLFNVSSFEVVVTIFSASQIVAEKELSLLS